MKVDLTEVQKMVQELNKIEHVSAHVDIGYTVFRDNTVKSNRVIVYITAKDKESADELLTQVFYLLDAYGYPIDIEKGFSNLDGDIYYSGGDKERHTTIYIHVPFFPRENYNDRQLQLVKQFFPDCEPVVVKSTKLTETERWACARK